MTQKLYKSTVSIGKVLELNSGGGLRILPGLYGTRREAAGIYLSKEDLVDLAETLLAQHAPERLVQSGPKLDDRFKVGDWAERRYESTAFPDLNGPLQILEIRPYTDKEREFMTLVPKDAVRIYYTKDGQESYIASNWLVPADAPKPPKLSEQVGKFFQNISDGEIVRIVDVSAYPGRKDFPDHDWARAEKENGLRKEIYNEVGVKDWWVPVEVEESTTTTWIVKQA